MRDLAMQQRTGLLKIKIACKTCGVSESFYSNLSVEKFKARHIGHDIAGGNEQVMPPEAGVEKSVPEARKSLERESGTKTAKIVVDLLNFPSLDSPIFRVRGFDVNLDEAFTATMSFAEIAKVRDMLATGEYLDRDASGQLYVWEQDAVEYVGEVKDKLGLSAQAQAAATTAQPSPDLSESQEVIDQATVAGATEVLIDALGGEGTCQADGETVSASVSPMPDPSEKVEGVASVSPQESTQVRPPTLELAEVRVTSRPAPANPVEKRAAERASNAVKAPPGEANEDEYLLVSKSWYIQGGKGNRKEAVKVSKVLKAFRWKVEPIYTIGVILDDMLSIETTRSQISGTLIKRVESAGYRLTAVTIDQGKPIAWFKREGPGMPSLHVGPVAEGLDDPEIELESDVTG
jgi:hypothetical protein